MLDIEVVGGDTGLLAAEEDQGFAAAAPRAGAAQGLTGAAAAGLATALVGCKGCEY